MDLPKVPRTVLGLTWREHIGGRWAVSTAGFALVAPVAFLAVFINVQRFDATELWLWAAASGLSLAVMGFIWWLASITLLRRRSVAPASIGVVVGVGFISGAIRSVVATVLTVEWQLFPASEGFAELLPFRAAVGGFQGALGLPVLAMSLSLIARYRTKRLRLLSQLVGVREKRAEEAGAMKALRDALSGPVQTRLRELADRLGEDDVQVSQVSIAVRNQAHELWAQSKQPSDPPRIRLWDVVRIGLSINPLPLSAVWLMWVPPAVLTLVTRNVLPIVVVQVLAGALVLTAIYIAGRWLVQRFRHLGFVVFLIGTLGGGFVAGLVMLVIVGASGSDANTALIGVSTVWLASVTLVVSLVESAVLRSQQVLTDIATSIDDVEVALHSEQRVRAELAHEVAGVLHGVVQGRLAIAQRASEGSTALARQALDDGIERLAEPAVLTATSARDLAQQVSAPWTALMAIDINASEGWVGGSQARDMSDVLEECLSNAFRHGHAMHALIDIDEADGAWLIRVQSDGAEPSHASINGMGSSLFESVSGGKWSRSAGDDGGCVVTVRLN